MDFNPRSQRRERLETGITVKANSKASIHAPSEGSDGSRGVPLLFLGPTSIHAPSEGSDFATLLKCEKIDLLQSTLPAKGATAWSG